MWKVCSPVVVYSLVVFALLSVPVYYAASAAVRQLASKDNSFHDQIYNMTPLLLLHAHPLLPFLHWPEAKAAAAYLNSWTKFEVSTWADRPPGRAPVLCWFAYREFRRRYNQDPYAANRRSSSACAGGRCSCGCGSGAPDRPCWRC